ncbi:MAG TPA: ZIP family metal transporter [Patescibacteria group bacterium]|nr:ZIP family metal transporter [Patescibacteria group bacterium]
MNPAGFLPFFSTLAGGFAALRLQHRIHALMALAAGVVVATAIADLLPEALLLAGPSLTLQVGVFGVGGFIGFSYLEAFFHQSSFEHGDEEASPAPGNAASRARPGIVGLLPPVSLVGHSAMDGLAIGLGFQAGDEVGLIVTVAVLFHDFADGMNIATIALEAARGQRVAVVFVLLDAVAAPVGAAAASLITIQPATLGLFLAMFAGVFVAVGAGHLLPESQHRDPGREPLMVSLAAIGAVAVLAIRALAV